MAPTPPTRDKILSLFFSKPRRRFSLPEILKGMSGPRGELQAVTDCLRQLCREGKLVRLKKNHYALPDAANCLSGKIQAHPDGFGFLMPDEQGREDIYLNRREMGRGIHGDRGV